MNALNRRFFVKTLLAGAASAAPACAPLHRRIAVPANTTNGDHDLQSNGDSASLNIDVGSQQLRIAPIGSPLSFQNFLRVGSEWKPATLADVPFVTGASFPLITESIRRSGSSLRCEGTAKAEG